MYLPTATTSERSILPTQALEAAHQGAQAGGVEEIHLTEVGDDVPGAAGEKPDYALATRGAVYASTSPLTCRTASLRRW